MSSGSGPTDSGKSTYWPGPIRVPGWAVHVTVVTAWVIWAPSRSIGWGSTPLVTTASQPGWGVVRAEVIGWSTGKVTSTFVVPAVSDSLGTRKVITV